MDNAKKHEAEQFGKEAYREMKILTTHVPIEAERLGAECLCNKEFENDKEAKEACHDAVYSESKKPEEPVYSPKDIERSREWIKKWSKEPVKR